MYVRRNVEYHLQVIKIVTVACRKESSETRYRRHKGKAYCCQSYDGACECKESECVERLCTIADTAKAVRQNFKGGARSIQVDYLPKQTREYEVYLDKSSSEWEYASHYRSRESLEVPYLWRYFWQDKKQGLSKSITQLFWIA